MTLKFFAYMLPLLSCTTVQTGSAQYSTCDTSTCIQATLGANRKLNNPTLFESTGLKFTNSNVFIVDNGVIKTPKLSNKLLPGITRKFLTDLIIENKLDFVHRLNRKRDIYGLWQKTRACKNEEFSIKFRENGNDYLRKGELNKALCLYNEALLFGKFCII